MNRRVVRYEDIPVRVSDRLLTGRVPSERVELVSSLAFDPPSKMVIRRAGVYVEVEPRLVDVWEGTKPGLDESEYVLRYAWMEEL